MSESPSYVLHEAHTAFKTWQTIITTHDGKTGEDHNGKPWRMNPDGAWEMVDEAKELTQRVEVLESLVNNLNVRLEKKEASK